jgi:hypothetical protein
MKRKFSKIAITFIAAAALIIGCVAGGALAYLVGNTDPVTNTFVAGEVKCVVEQNDNSTSATVKNTGNVRAYIRATVVGNTLNDAGQVTGNANLDTYLVGADWTQGTDGYYYYNSIVDPSKTTTDLFKSDAPTSTPHLLITVLAEAIQADGMPGVANAQAAFDYAKTH